jgi:hypothetical protein
MDSVQAAAFLHAALTALVVGFQLALAAGAPWGEAAMGGTIKGRFPPPLRVAAVVQAILLTVLAAVVLSRADVALPGWSQTARWAIWVAVGFAAVATVMNLITRSLIERRIWAPVAIGLLATALWVALRASEGSPATG